MTYKLEFLPSALKEWHKLDHTVKTQFKKKIIERLEQPRVPSSQLRGWSEHYKIKLKSLGYRLVYEVLDSKKTVQVIAVGKREKNSIYITAKNRSP
jgi:mRNA interferase RelE/StbE